MDGGETSGEGDSLAPVIIVIVLALLAGAAGAFFWFRRRQAAKQPMADVQLHSLAVGQEVDDGRKGSLGDWDDSE